VASDRKRKETSNNAQFDAGASGGSYIRRCVCLSQQHSLHVVCHFIPPKFMIERRSTIVVANLVSVAMKLLWVSYEKS
jgi:hypothetical protein